MSKFLWVLTGSMILIVLVGVFAPMKVERNDVVASEEIKVESLFSNFTDGTVKKFYDGDVLCYIYKEGYSGSISCLK